MKKIIQITEKELYEIVSSYLGIRDSETIQIIADTNKSIVVSIDSKK